MSPSLEHCPRSARPMACTWCLSGRVRGLCRCLVSTCAQKPTTGLPSPAEDQHGCRAAAWSEASRQNWPACAGSSGRHCLWELGTQRRWLLQPLLLQGHSGQAAVSPGSVRACGLLSLARDWPTPALSYGHTQSVTTETRHIPLCQAHEGTLTRSWPQDSMEQDQPAHGRASQHRDVRRSGSESPS